MEARRAASPTLVFTPLEIQLLDQIEKSSSRKKYDQATTLHIISLDWLN